ncbi:MAG: hypothetical protein ACYDC8_14975 [Gammaproteobacteria bacterium]
MVKPNYQFEKRQKELAKKKKKDEKAQRKLQEKGVSPDTAVDPDKTETSP